LGDNALPDLNNYVSLKKPLNIDKENLEKIMKIGIGNKLESSFYFIFNFYNNLISSRSLYMNNKMTLLQEFYEKLPLFRLKEKYENLLEINKCIDSKLQKIQLKKELIISNLKNISYKISKICLTQDDFKQNYFQYKEREIKEMMENILTLKNSFFEFNENLRKLEERSKKIIFLKQKLNSKFIDKDDLEKLIIFTKIFTNFYNCVENLSKSLK